MRAQRWKQFWTDWLFFLRHTDLQKGVAQGTVGDVGSKTDTTKKWCERWEEKEAEKG